MSRTWVNALLFQIVWFAAALGWVALSRVPIVGILFALTNTIAGEEYGTRQRRGRECPVRLGQCRH